MQALEKGGSSWWLSLTTPSLPGIWAALLIGRGISVRTMHRIPDGIHDVGRDLDLPKLPSIELRLLVAANISQAAGDLCDILRAVIATLVKANR
jgi:hypothetical protein